MYPILNVDFKKMKSIYRKKNEKKICTFMNQYSISDSLNTNQQIQLIRWAEILDMIPSYRMISDKEFFNSVCDLNGLSTKSLNETYHVTFLMSEILSMKWKSLAECKNSCQRDLVPSNLDIDKVEKTPNYSLWGLLLAACGITLGLCGFKKYSDKNKYEPFSDYNEDPIPPEGIA